MKKFMVMLLMVVAVMFASPLFALDESPPGVKTFNSTNSGEIIYGKNGLSQVGAARADNIAFIKVEIDTSMYSWSKGIYTKISGISGAYKQDTQNDGTPYDGELAITIGQVESAGVTYARSM